MSWQYVPTNRKTRYSMKIISVALAIATLALSAGVVLADPQRANRAETAITCQTVRAYVSQVGVAAAKAIARANGMTASQERQARQCLASRD
jgi:hypothetical protein